MPKLIVSQGDEKKTIILTDVTTIGRHSSNDIVVQHSSASRHHAEIVVKGQHVILRDLNSSNGTYLNGQRVGRVLLKDKDIIRIGNVEMMFLQDDEQASSVSFKEKDITRIDSSSMDLELEKKLKEYKVVKSSHLKDGESITGSKIESAISNAKVETNKSKDDKLLESDRKRLSMLLEAIQALGSLREVNDLLNLIMDLLFKTMDIDRGFIMLLDEKTDELIPKVSRHSDGSGQGSVNNKLFISKTIADSVLKEGTAVITMDALNDPRFKRSESAIAQNVRSAICVPLKTQKKTRGLIYIDNLITSNCFSDDDLEYMKAFSSYASVALENAYLYQEAMEKERITGELMIARNIQKGLLPPGDPVIEGFDVYAVSLPAKEVGGDFYEFITIDDHTVGVGVGDVAGKGVPAALFMAVSGTVLHAKAENQKNPEDVISSMNKILYPKTNRQKSVSLAYCVIDTRTRKVKVANSGLILPIHYSSELSRCEPIAVNGIPIGIMPHMTYKNKDVTLKSGDILILQSDGILEARNEKDEIFGIDHFIDIVEENCTLSAKSIVEKILDEVESFIGNNPQSDDITLVVIKAK